MIYVNVTRILPILYIFLLISCQNEDENFNRNQSEEALKYLEDYERPATLWGFIDTNNEIVIEEQFDIVNNFHNGRCAVNKAGEWFFINKKGLKISPESYKACYNYQDGYARVQLWDGTYNFLDQNFQFLYHQNFHFAKDFNNGYSVVQELADGPISLLNKEGEIILPYNSFIDDYRIIDVNILNDNLIELVSSEHHYFYNLNSGKQSKQKYDRIKKGNQQELIVKKDNQYHVINEEEDILFKGFQHITHSQDDIYTGIKNENIYVIKSGEEFMLDDYINHISYAGDSVFIYYSENNLQGILDYNLDSITSPKYEQIYHFTDKRAPYKKNGLWGFLDINGHELTPAQYGLIWPSNEGLSRVMFRQGVGIIDRKFEVVTPPGLGELRDFHEGLAAFREQSF